jgi:threonine synthase
MLSWSKPTPPKDHLMRLDASAGPLLLDRSGGSYPAMDRRWRGDDGSPLALSPLPGLKPAQIRRDERSLWRYQNVLPVDPAQQVSLGEGLTPMVPMRWGAGLVHFKLEWFNPTSSFKDRGASVMVSHLRAQGATVVLEDSSGNGGAAVAAYAAAAGIRAKLLVPVATSAAKILQARAFGAAIELVGGTRDDVAAEAIRQSELIPYASHNWHPYFLQGIKTMAYEIWEALDFTAPDNVVLVAGAGSQILGCDIAFSELLAAGQIEQRPRLLVGQPEHWATIADTVNGINPGTRGARVPTIAEGASIANPVRLPEAVAAIRRSNGAAVAVPEPRIHTTVRKLAACGLYAEPTSAVAVAALDQFLAEGAVQPDETTVVVLTGSGLKSADKMGTIFAPQEERTLPLR